MGAKSDNQGWGILAGVVLVGFVVSKCTDEPSAPVPIATGSPIVSKASITAGSLGDITSADIMYIAARRVTCRAEPNVAAARVTRLMFGDAVQMSEARGRWTQVTSPAATACWVATRFLSDEKPELEPLVESAALATATSTGPPALRVRESLALLASPRSRAQSRALCGAKWKCGQMDSCSEAMHYLNECGVGRLDGDGDGVPCESIC